MNREIQEIDLCEPGDIGNWLYTPGDTENWLCASGDTGN